MSFKGGYFIGFSHPPEKLANRNGYISEYVHRFANQYKHVLHLKKWAQKLAQSPQALPSML